jgi:hypothetical protein
MKARDTVTGIVDGIDGVDHINVYSKGKTSIGRWLSHFTCAKFEHPRFGRFLSVEGFWYWRLTEESPQRERLRLLSGWAAKQAGRDLARREDPDSAEFRRDVIEAEIAKLEAHPAKRAEFMATTLPLAHYYEYPSGRVIGGAQWVIAELEKIRAAHR